MNIMQDSREATMFGRRSDGTQVRRPLSPHMQVYDMLQMTSLMSILGRVTGAAWSAGLALMVWWLMAAASGPDAFATVQAVLGSFVGLVVLFGLSLAAWFHTIGGIRHLGWDVGWGFDLPTTYRTGRLVAIATVLAVALTWAVAFFAWAS